MDLGSKIDGHPESTTNNVSLRQTNTIVNENIIRDKHLAQFHKLGHRVHMRPPTKNVLPYILHIVRVKIGLN